MLAQMAPQGTSRFWGPKSKKLTFYEKPNWQYFCEKLLTTFLTIRPYKVELLLNIGNFFHTIFFMAKKLNLGNLFYGPSVFS